MTLTTCVYDIKRGSMSSKGCPLTFIELCEQNYVQTLVIINQLDSN